MRPVLLLYNLSIRFYSFAIRLASFWNKKAAAWIDGRNDVFNFLEQNISKGDKYIWMHCSSAGEFEQGKPVIEALKREYPHTKVLVTFFSPSGYSVAKKYPFADLITYLPVDTKKNAERFYQLVKPELALFVKYEFWYHHLSHSFSQQVPVLLVSAVFRKDQIFFKQYGKFFKQILHFFRHIFVQDTTSLQLLQTNGIPHCSISGDTRFDRVNEIAESGTEIPFINTFIANQKVIVAGSTWPGDEEVLAQYLKQNSEVKLILAPHEINESHVQSIQALFERTVLYSKVLQKSGQMDTAAPDSTSIALAQVLIIDSVGLLSRLYRYATITYVGGGFTKDGIHNILEAAVWAKPVIFGPTYHKYREGREMMQSGGAFSINTAQELKKIADDLLTNENHLQSTSLKAKIYISENTGATNKIMETIQEKRLLTS